MTPPKSASQGSVAPTDDRSRILAAYMGMWHAYVVAARTSDYQSPALARHSAGGARSLLVRGLLNAHKQGIVTLGTPTFKPRVTTMTPVGHPNRASVKDCADSSHWLTYNRAGAVVGDRSPGRRSIEADLRLLGDSWKVTQLVVEKEGTC
jgi:hypothetical protein